MRDSITVRAFVRNVPNAIRKPRRAFFVLLALFVVIITVLVNCLSIPVKRVRAAELAANPASAAPTPTLAPGQHFTDVPPGDGFYEPITWGSDQHIFSGYPNGDGTASFRPGNQTTRAQVAKMLVLAEGWTTDTRGGPHFLDVPPTNVLYDMVETAYQHGIVSGNACGAPGEPCPGSYFRPGNAVTRGQFAKMLVLAAGWPLTSGNQPVFADVATTQVFYTAIQTAYANGAISGYPCGAVGEPCPGVYYRPSHAVSRAQVAKLIYISYRRHPPTATPTVTFAPGTPPPPTTTLPPTATATRTLPPLTATATGTAQATTTPATAIYWGGYISGATYDPTWGDAPWDARTLAAFESHAGKAVSIIHFGQAWQAGSGSMNAFDVGPFNLTRAHGAIPLINWNPWQYCCGATQPNWRLSNIIAGQYDSYITQWASAAHAWGHPFFLRIMDEMNGTWYPWSEGANGNQPGQYVLAWRHIHDLFVAAGATNAIWVWNPNTEYSGSLPLEGLYPGDPYVDWVGMTGYNFGPTNRGDVWTSFGALFGPLYTHLGQIAPTKRVMIGETASTETGGSKAAWISDALATQLPTQFPRVKALVWFNWTAEGYDWMIETSSTAQTAFAQGIAAPYYATNQFGNLNQAP